MKLIKTQDYLLLIDEEVSIDINNYIVAKDLSGIAKVKEYKRGHILAIDVFQNTELGISYHQTSDWNKIVAYYPLTKEAKELDLLLLPNPFKTYRVGRKQKRAILDEKGVEIGVFKTGSEEQAQKYCDYLNNKQFSLEDMKKAIKMAQEQFWDVENYGFYSNTEGDLSFKYTEEEIIQSLFTQQLPKEFIPEYDIIHTDHAPNGFEKLLKFKTNSEGKKEIQGTYKY